MDSKFADWELMRQACVLSRYCRPSDFLDDQKDMIDRSLRSDSVEEAPNWSQRLTPQQILRSLFLRIKNWTYRELPSGLPRCTLRQSHETSIVCRCLDTCIHRGFTPADCPRRQVDQ